MKYDPDKHHRRSIRLKGYDYSQPGAHFVTICTQDRACLLGEVVEGEMRLNDAGRIVEWTWQDLLNHVTNVELGAFVVMPNHVHGIIIVTDHVGHNGVGAGSEPAPTTTTTRTAHALPEIIRQFKTFSARRINQVRRTPGAPVWQRNYYEHVIRNDDELNRIREYITRNPQKWAVDGENPHALKPELDEPWRV